MTKTSRPGDLVADVVTLSLQIKLPLVAIDEHDRVWVFGLPSHGLLGEDIAAELERRYGLVGAPVDDIPGTVAVGAAPQPATVLEELVREGKARRASFSELDMIRGAIRLHEHRARRGVPTRWVRWKRWCKEQAAKRRAALMTIPADEALANLGLAPQGPQEMN